ncbi:Holliday junction branch migration protein RuvA [Lactobacillus sp. CC-MHH1034]|uniref:Holliday junction branch migration protein RuvA n=1 Tax=Agrilactobacillus fermenti TaxID=2586909 RepID=UPI001E3BA6B0|nr:Holliday junction branch migration protein RuvA [Agrilactobacillus fermenti]MCD2256761.1 Holliday junction branch migration protein RuvA [Agrilactobacillus fermenti]
MFEYLKGLLVQIEASYVVLDVNGIGYKILVANPFAYTEAQTTKIYIHQTITESAQILYGFVDQAEKQLFELLIAVTGIGPKSALAILAASNHDGLIKAIRTEDIKFLTKFPGVGKKTAQQIVIDLKDKVTKLGQRDIFATESSVVTKTKPQEASSLQDALAALSALGFSNREVQKIVPTLEQFSADSTDAYLREGLRLLTK